MADKDGGFTDYTVQVKVLTPREGTQGLIDQVQALIPGSLNDGQGNIGSYIESSAKKVSYSGGDDGTTITIQAKGETNKNCLVTIPVVKSTATACGWIQPSITREAMTTPFGTASRWSMAMVMKTFHPTSACSTGSPLPSMSSATS